MGIIFILFFGGAENRGEIIEQDKNVKMTGGECDVEQVAESYMLKRDHPKFKGN